MDVLCWQKLQLASLPIDDMDLRSFGMALRRLQALNVWSVLLSSTACKGTLEVAGRSALFHCLHRHT